MYINILKLWIQLRNSTYLSIVKIYLELAASLPPCNRVPNWPIGCRRLMLLLPTKFCAKLIIVDISDASPWWYAECSATEPASCATLTSRLSLRFKHVKSTYYKRIYYYKHMGVDSISKIRFHCDLCLN